MNLNELEKIIEETTAISGFKVANAAASLLSEDGALEAVSHFNVAFDLKDAIEALRNEK